MRAYELIGQWADQRAQSLRADAKKARETYTKGPLYAACCEYADDLDQAATLLEARAKSYRRHQGLLDDRAALPKGPAHE